VIKTREIRRKLSVGAVMALFLTVAVSVCCITPAFAVTEYHETASTLVRVYVEAPCQPKIAIFASHFESTSDHGSGDSMSVGFILPMPGGGQYLIPVGCLADSSERVSLLQEVNVGFPCADNVKKVGRWAMQVCRIGKSVIVYWNSPIGGAITGKHPNGKTWAEIFGIASFELPPGIMILRGYGEAATENPFTMPLHASYGWRVTQSGTVYSAKGSIIVPKWHYCGSFADTPTPPRLNTLCDLTYSHA
jgi:hypothetical protein